MKTISAVDVALKFLEDNIVKGVFVPGQQIKEEEVSAQLDISRPPIREAFKILEGEGLVVRKPNKGVFVNEITEKDIWEVYTLKETLERMTVSLSFDLITEEDINKLERLIYEMEACLELKGSKRLRKYQDLNSRFHSFFVDLANHSRLKSICANLDIQIKRLSFHAFSDENHMRHSCKQHQAILKAIRAGDKSKTMELSARHARENAAVHNTLIKKIFKEE